ncbi:hypothetical protein [Anaerotignum sp.]|uniref:hypothetical protein n=1 Tax=Anaerotignum sp. TaxID=2039241 RepID=UPI002714DAA4|nr:hypothetical protein [Anaerotignum sp.]
MKSFFQTFVMSLIVCYVIFFFVGGLIFENLWALLMLIALVISILINQFIYLETKIEELETRIKTLEKPSEHED